MKVSGVLFTAIFAFATVNSHYLPDFGKGPLHEDIQYFLDLIPMDKVASVVLEYAAEDSEFQELLQYFGSSQFKTMVSEIETLYEFHKFADYLEKNGVYIYAELNKLNKIIGIPPFQQFSKKQITGGVKGLFEDVKQLISYDVIIRGYVYKMRTSDAWRDFVAQLKSQDNQKFVDALYENRNYLSFRAMLVNKGIDIILIEDIIYTVLGIEFPIFEMPKSKTFASDELSRDIHDFLNLVDENKIMNIVMSYLEDDEVQRAIEYMYSEAFHDLVRKVEAMPEYQNLVKYMEDSGLDMTKVISKIHKLFGMEDYVPPKKFSSMNTLSNLGGLKALFNAVEAALPLDKFTAMYNEKMHTSPAFQNFMQRLHSNEFQTIVNTVYQSPIFLEMRQKVINDGVDLVPIRDFIEKVLGIHLPRVNSRAMLRAEIFASDELSRDIHDFLNLVDENKIMNIVMSYLEDDEVQRAIEYMYSEAFHDLVRKVEAMPEYQNLVKYMEDSGLDMTKVISKIHKLFGMEDYVPPKKFSSMNTLSNLGGLKALFNAVEAALPLDKFTAMYNEKMHTSPAFQNFMQRLHSNEFQSIVNMVYQSPIFLEMRQKVINDGVDLVPIRDFIEKVLGIHLPRVNSRAMLRAETFASDELSRDIHDFLNLVDENKIMNIVMSYLDDDEVQRAIEYMYSEAFHDLVRKVEAMPEYQNLVKYMEDSGLDMRKVISKIHKLFGMEDYVPPMEFSSMNTLSNLGGLKALFNAVEAALPLDKFTAMYNEKMHTSPAFQNFMQRLHSNEFQTIVNMVYQSPIFLEMRQKVINDGVDLVPIRDFIEKVLGIHLPRVNFRAMLRAETFASDELSRDIHDFLNLVDENKIMNIVMSYLDDDEVQRAIEYMYSEAFHDLVRKVEAMPEYQNLVKYMEDSGLDMRKVISKIHKLFGMEDYVPPMEFSSMNTLSNLGGLKALFNAVEAALPLDKFTAMYNEKMHTSPAFQNFMQRLHSNEFQTIVNTVYQSPIFLEMRQKVINDGVDLVPIRDFIEKVLGIHLPRVNFRAML
ncbi:uncharacterized protein LOC126919929 isoform X2 [Bombus affinis]|uniref:uncharacterized protein LOC126919929 isoform X2 n=1 Tax=Bombus affinis TaxID=309941 RepID=UPI0021B7081F|nr:uncharacterized protein LOC126919929 isoform X2 [Bombus affinis]